MAPPPPSPSCSGAFPRPQASEPDPFALVVELLKGATLTEVAERHGVHPGQLATWKARFVSGARDALAPDKPPVDVADAIAEHLLAHGVVSAGPRRD